MKSTPLLRQLFAVVLITTFISLACRKNDWRLQVDNQDKQNEALFFNAYSPNSPAAQAVLHFTKNQNAQYHFAAHYLEQIGKPRWDKALVFESRNAARAATAAVDSTVVYIPFVRDAQQYVNASLIVNMKPGDTTFRMLYDWEYKNFGFEQPQGAGWNAGSMMQMYMQMDRQVFGTERFKITDGRLLPASLLHQLQASQLPLDSIDVIASFNKEKQERVETAAFSYISCNTTYYCVRWSSDQKAFRGAASAALASSDCIEYSSSVSCVTNWSDNWGGSGSTPKSEGPAMGGGGGSGWSNPKPPTSPTNCPETIGFKIGTDGSCLNGWKPDIFDPPPPDLPCLRAIASMVNVKNLLNNPIISNQWNAVTSTVSSDVNEKSFSFGSGNNGTQVTNIITSSSSSSTPITATNAGFTVSGAFHTHTSGAYDMFSPGDIYALADAHKANDQFSHFFVTSSTGATYAMSVIDSKKLSEFLSKYPVSQNLKPGTTDWTATSEMGGYFEMAFEELKKQGNTIDGAFEGAMSYIVKKFKMGISLSKRDSNGDFIGLYYEEQKPTLATRPLPLKKISICNL